MPELWPPAILLTGSVEAHDDQSIHRAGSVTITGITNDGWSLLETSDTPLPGDREVVLGYRTAMELHVKSGDTVSLWVELPSSIPRDSLLGERDETTLEIQATVSHVLSESTGASRFSLTPAQQLPYNAFLALDTLQTAAWGWKRSMPDVAARLPNRLASMQCWRVPKQLRTPLQAFRLRRELSPMTVVSPKRSSRRSRRMTSACACGRSPIAATSRRRAIA
ncbi:MAG: hypothetical protein R3C19_18190 [Planctomycetaceae bacterium]